ncbi:SCO5717 family growth-regulating ATPase, partial [Streptomyces sp. UNOC14_S4]|uniref:SCO5717 family growth-regulating ATPase n=1 Tax=Streptomyces sp. UNOC14_S4 TaxID=2872340 RepID=UPI0027E38343
MSSDRDEHRAGGSTAGEARSDAGHENEADHSGEFTIDYTPPAWYTQNAVTPAAAPAATPDHTGAPGAFGAPSDAGFTAPPPSGEPLASPTGAGTDAAADAVSANGSGDRSGNGPWDAIAAAEPAPVPTLPADAPQANAPQADDRPAFTAQGAADAAESGQGDGASPLPFGGDAGVAIPAHLIPPRPAEAPLVADAGTETGPGTEIGTETSTETGHAPSGPDATASDVTSPADAAPQADERFPLGAEASHDVTPPVAAAQDEAPADAPWDGDRLPFGGEAVSEDAPAAADNADNGDAQSDRTMRFSPVVLRDETPSRAGTDEAASPAEAPALGNPRGDGTMRFSAAALQNEIASRAAEPVAGGPQGDTDSSTPN